MNPNLARLIADYQQRVRTAVALMQASGIARPSTHTDWVATLIPRELKGGIRCFKHGYGCKVALPEGSVDFDFGAHGENDGFDTGRLADFAGARLADYGFASEDALRACFDAEVAAGALVYSGYILYYVAGAGGRGAAP